ncbi:MAG: hypothetical protein CMG91_10125, partial [Marinobacter sp.]|nr:hypothetical protein [Marinobacter sp.]
MGGQAEEAPKTARSHGWRSRAYREVFTACFRSLLCLADFSQAKNPWPWKRRKKLRAELSGRSKD